MLQTKNLLRLLLKVCVAALLLWWVVKSDKLDLKSSLLIFSNHGFLLTSFAIMALTGLILGSLRFQLVLKLFQIDITFMRLVRYQGIGLFANTFMPGAVGGDILKAYYIKSDHPQASIPKLVLAILMDRVIGMLSLFLVSLTVSAIHLNSVLRESALRSMLAVNAALILGFVVFFVVCINLRRHEARLRAIVQRLPFKSDRLKRPLESAYSSFVLIGRNPKLVLQTTSISCLIQLLNIGLFWLITRLFGDAAVPFNIVSLIIPLGTLALTIPLAPGGIGVGHVAFEKLFALFHFEHGANYYNIFFISNLMFSLAMSIFYLTHPRVKVPENPEDDARALP